MLEFLRSPLAYLDSFWRSTSPAPSCAQPQEHETPSEEICVSTDDDIGRGHFDHVPVVDFALAKTHPDAYYRRLRFVLEDVGFGVSPARCVPATRSHLTTGLCKCAWLRGLLPKRTLWARTKTLQQASRMEEHPWHGRILRSAWVFPR